MEDIIGNRLTNIYTKGHIEEEPDDNDGRKRACQLGGAKRLDEEEDNDDTAGDANNGGVRNVWFDNFEALDGTQD